MRATDLRDTANALDRKFRRIETDAAAAIDLQIEKRRRYPARRPIRNRFAGRTHGDDPPRVAFDIDKFSGRVVAGADEHVRGTKTIGARGNPLYDSLSSRLYQPTSVTPISRR